MTIAPRIRSLEARQAYAALETTILETLMTLSGTSVLVTGASRGIGRAVAVRLAAEGARVGIHYHRNRTAAGETLAGLKGSGHCFLQADLGDPHAVRRLVEEAADELGGIGVLVSNAGVYSLHPPAKVSYEQWLEAWNSTIATNLLGAANVAFCAAQHMIRAGGGRIISITSRGAFRGEPDAPAYGASKAGLNAVSQSLAKALAPHGVLSFAVAPGWVDTDMAQPFLEGSGGHEVRVQSPLGRIATSEEIASVVLFLATAAPASMTGSIIDVNGASYLRT